MQSLYLLFGCVSFALIPFASATVETYDVPLDLAKCFGYYKKKTNLIKTTASAIVSMCDNYYSWMHAKELNVNRKANADTRLYINRLFDQTKAEISQFQTHRRMKRQAVGNPPKKLRLRKEIRMLSDRERQTYFDAVNSAKANTTISPNKYDALAEFHTGMTSVSAHGGCNFHGWHRMYILMFENALREEGPQFAHVTVPYWDSRLDSRMTNPAESVVFTERLFGTCDGPAKGGIMRDGWESATGVITRACATDGPLFNDEMVYNVTRQSTLGAICGEDSEIDNDLEFHHNGAHRYIDGQMAMLQSAVYDPIFWAHHTFVDLIWEIFRKNQVANNVDPETDYPPNPTTMGAHELHIPTADMGFADLKVIDGLSNMFTEEWYTYAPPPSCTVGQRDCGSKFLKCVVDRPTGNRPRARCVSRTLPEVVEWEEEAARPTTPQPPTHCPPSNGTITPIPAVLTPVKIVKPVQNTFCLNGKSDTNQWVYVPVKVIFRRPPEFKSYGSYPVERGKIVKYKGDIYAPSSYSNVYQHLRNPDVPKQYDGCIEPDEPTNTIFIRSVGLNYEGTYKEFAIVDRRLAVTVATAYVAVRKPMSSTDVSIAMLHAQDRCGRVCRPICKVPGTEIFRPCSGAIKLAGVRPLQYGNSFGDAVLGVWDFNQDKDCPQLTTNNMIVSFYCDYKTDWVWPSVDPGIKPVTPPLPVEKTTITAGCSLGHGCVVAQSCDAIMPCGSNNARVECMDSCHMFARCLNGRFFIHQCRRGERYDPASRTGCSPGFCDYRKSGTKNWGGASIRGRRGGRGRRFRQG